MSGLSVKKQFLMIQFFYKKGSRSGRPIDVILFLLASVVLFAACAKDKEETPEALFVLIKQLESNSGSCNCEPYIDQYLWKKKTVYLLGYRGPACNWIPTFYDEQGNMFSLESGYSFDAFLQEGKRIKEVWSCK
ncbi:MAG TPA: hypothetical protein VM843_01020 [Flavisolibacter sp.]|jgi:hypothetical protein|nr:hypothetical protein [Flavisolibacter sp.]